MAVPGNSPQATISMWSAGDYSLHTQGAKDVIDNTAPLALAAIERMEVAESSAPFQLVDYAAADGGTSLDLHHQIISAVRKRAATRPISVTYTDLPSNDFSALFRIVQGENPNFASYLPRHENVFTFATATSFFEPIMPPERGPWLLGDCDALVERNALPDQPAHPRRRRAG